MTRSQEVLLLTVARILRGKIKNEVYAEQASDLWALDEALAPFDPTPAQQSILDGFTSNEFSGGTCSGG